MISSLVSFSLGLDRPSSEFLLVMFLPLVSVSPGLVRVTALTSTRLQARTAPFYGNRSWIPWDQEHWRELAPAGTDVESHISG